MQDIFESVEYKEAELLSKHTTFRIGGPARYFFMPENAKQLTDVIDYCKSKSKKYAIIGNGSNVLFPDDGFDGFLIQIYNNMNKMIVENESIYAEAGALLSKLAVTARDNSLTGMEFAAGIPGTLGGAIVMNAGAYGGEMKDIISFVDILEPDGKTKRYKCEDMDFGYRQSIVKDDKIVVGACLDLKSGNIEEINNRMKSLKEARVSKQPLEYPSAGSTFKRPEGYFAGKLIEDSGLGGYRVGGAMVSERHCGFVINYDNATCDDVLRLIDDVKKIVNDKFGVLLEPEVKIIR